MKKPKNPWPNFNEKRCARCGKLFVPGVEHLYKKYHRYYCGWTCYLHSEDKELKLK